MGEEIFDESIEPEDDIGDFFDFVDRTEGEETVSVPIGELVFHQVMTAVSGVLLQVVPVFNEFGSVRLLREDDVQMILDEGEIEDE
jgi:hypothetical protein